MSPVPYIKTTAGWVDLARVGPAGPPGPTGPQGPAGAPLAVQRVEGGDTTEQARVLTGAYGEFGNLANAGSATSLRLSYSPSVDCWWAVTYHLGQLSKPPAGDGWGYGYCDLQLLAGSSVMPAVGGVAAHGPGDSLVRMIGATFGPSAQPYIMLTATKWFPLAAGGTYTIRPLWAQTTQHYLYCTRWQLYAQGVAYPR